MAVGLVYSTVGLDLPTYMCWTTSDDIKNLIIVLFVCIMSHNYLILYWKFHAAAAVARYTLHSTYP